MDDGILTDGKGRTVSFKNSIIIMTSNIGSKKILEMTKKEQEAALVAGRRPKYSKLSAVVKGELDKAMKPEFLNRIDEVVIFQPLTEDELAEIAARMALNIALRTKLDRNVNIVVQPALLQQMVKEGSKAASQYGARPMRRAVQRILEDAICTAVMKNFVQNGDTATFDLDGDDTRDEECDLDPDDDDMLTYMVKVSRERDDEILKVEMEESCRDMVGAMVLDDDDDVEDDVDTVKPNGTALQPVADPLA